MQRISHPLNTSWRTKQQGIVRLSDEEPVSELPLRSAQEPGEGGHTTLASSFDVKVTTCSVYSNIGILSSLSVRDVETTADDPQ